MQNTPFWLIMLKMLTSLILKSNELVDELSVMSIILVENG